MSGSNVPGALAHVPVCSHCWLCACSLAVCACSSGVLGPRGVCRPHCQGGLSACSHAMSAPAKTSHVEGLVVAGRGCRWCLGRAPGCRRHRTGVGLKVGFRVSVLAPSFNTWGVCFCSLLACQSCAGVCASPVLHQAVFASCFRMIL